MPQLFSVSLRALTLELLQAFLDGAETEPLLWEAKGGGKLDPHETRKQCGAFANSQEGGYLILGASLTSTGWVLDGMAFPDREPERWVTMALQEGVRPRPDYDVRPLAVGDGRHVAVVEIEPLAAGPCIVRGTVYERVAGASPPVKDPGRLAELYARGRNAHRIAGERAQIALGQSLWPLQQMEHEQANRQAFERAQRAATRSLMDIHDPYSGSSLDRYEEDIESDGSPKQFYVLLGLCTVTPSLDVGRRIFTVETRELLAHLIAEIGVEPAPPASEPRSYVAQDRRAVGLISVRDYRPDWAISAFWDGSVTVSVRTKESETVERIASELIRPAWQTAERLATELGSAGDGYLRIAVMHANSEEPISMGRGPYKRNESLDLDPIARELSRAFLLDVPEPST